MYKLPGPPSPRANAAELADFAELECLRNPRRSVSFTSLANVLKREQDNDPAAEEDEDAAAQEAVDGASAEIERRARSCGVPAAYPFQVDSTGASLHFPLAPLTDAHWLYTYLLLATRLNMAASGAFAGVNGPLLFEEVSACAAAAYWGPGTEKLVFGTASDVSSFAERVELLCRSLGEHLAFAPRPGVSSRRRDGALDLAVWKHFPDHRPGQLIGFGQCKTGTEWTGQTAGLHPGDFFAKWTSGRPAVLPVKMFFLAESLADDRWYEHCVDAGIVFDRCRVVSQAHSVASPLMDQVRTWTRTAVRQVLGTDLN